MFHKILEFIGQSRDVFPPTIIGHNENNEIIMLLILIILVTMTSDSDNNSETIGLRIN